MNRIKNAIADIHRDARAAVDPIRLGPVPLNMLFKAAAVAHVALPGLTVSAAARHLIEERHVSGPHAVEEMLYDAQRLDGLLFYRTGSALAFVNADDILPRRRFTAAHELAHAVLHRDRMGGFIADADISETDDATSEMEREANRFAAELLMPAEVIFARAEELTREYKACPRLVLAYRLASELLVSRQAIQYRLKTLGVGRDD